MQWRSNPIQALAPLAAGLLLLLFVASLALFLASRQQDAASSIRQTLAVEGRLGRVETLVTNAESAQRGFLLTGRLDYLEPYVTGRRAIGPELDLLGVDMANHPTFTGLRQLIAEKLAELQKTVDLRQAGQADQALAIVNNDQGARLMTGIRDAVDTMRQNENHTLEARSATAASLRDIGQAVLVGTLILVLLVGGVALKDGRRRIFELNAVNHALEVEGTERRTAEAQLRQLQKMEAVGQLTGGIAHDFNNMLAIVIGFLDLARRRADASNVTLTKYLANAMDGAERAVVLTKRLLAFSRLQPLEPSVVSLNKLVAGMSELLERAIGQTISVETVLAGGLWNAYADPAQIENALVNLAVNARDAMASGGHLTIETGNADLDDRYASEHSEVVAGQYVMLSVTDNGSGMPPSVLERAIDPFFTTKEVGKGSGLGLSQVFGFAKQSGGHLKIYSEIDQGTTVKIYLPRWRGRRDAAAEPSNAQPQAGAPTEVIFVVEDEAAVRLMTVASLRELGYTVLHASSPEEALKRLEIDQDIALLLTDIVMPGMNGRQLADRAVAQRPKLKVLYTTGYTRNAVVHNGIVDEGTAFLPKPFTLTQLATKVRQTLDVTG